MRRCGTECDHDRVRHLFAQAQRSRTVPDANKEIQIRVVYRVLYTPAVEGSRLRVRRLQEQHRMLNAVFNAANSSLDRMPDNRPYQYLKSTIGNARIVFLPRNADELTEERGFIEYHDASVLANPPANFNTIDPLQQTMSAMARLGYPPVEKVLNIYVAPIQTEILGAAVLGSNVMVVKTTAVGGVASPGTWTGATLGLTVCHEAGHAIGALPHTFDPMYCSMADADYPFTDIPRQRFPNYGAVVRLGATGQWEGVGCNRDRDCSHYAPGGDGGASNMEGSAFERPYSCGGADLSGCGERHESFTNVMDYSRDEDMRGFSKSQVNYMWRHLTGPGNTDLDIAIVDRTAELDTVDVPDEAPIGESQVVLPFETASAPPVSVDDSTQMTTTQIALVVVGSLIGVALIVALVRSINARKKASPPPPARPPPNGT